MDGSSGTLFECGVAMDAMTFEPDEIPSSPANWTNYCICLARRHVWLAIHASANNTKIPRAASVPAVM
jgi:hypothetical protein